MKDIICIYSHFCYNSFYFHNLLSFYIFPSNFLILHNQQSSLAFSIMQQSADAEIGRCILATPKGNKAARALKQQEIDRDRQASDYQHFTPQNLEDSLLRHKRLSFTMQKVMFCVPKHDLLKHARKRLTLIGANILPLHVCRQA